MAKHTPTNLDVEDRRATGAALAVRGFERVGGQFGAQVIGGAPADHAAGAISMTVARLSRLLGLPLSAYPC